MGRGSYREGVFKFLNSVSGVVQKSRDTGMNSTQSVSSKRSQSLVWFTGNDFLEEVEESHPNNLVFSLYQSDMIVIELHNIHPPESLLMTKMILFLAHRTACSMQFWALLD